MYRIIATNAYGTTLEYIPRQTLEEAQKFVAFTIENRRKLRKATYSFTIVKA